MDAFDPLSLPPRELVGLVWSRRKLWLATAAACGLLAAMASLMVPRYWEAAQGLVVRQETAGSSGSRPGKFADLYEMRTLQETILEIAKSQQVVVGTLEAVDRELAQATAAPSLEDIEKFRRRLKMLPPDGGEFGKTEVFYFVVKDSNRDRAILLVSHLCQQLELALKQLRGRRAASLIAELEQEVKVAEATLAGETERLAAFETQVGADLGELRMLHSANSGQSDLRMEAVQLESDVRKFRTQVREGQQLLELLRAAENDPQQLVATPNSLLTSQAALRRLKDGLVDAQLATSRLSGTRSADHPQVRAAVEAERQIRTELHDELVSAIRGAEVELGLSQDRLTATEQRLADLQARFAHLAELRAEYANRIAASENCRLTLDKARQNLSTARAAEAAAYSGSLVTRLDKPETGPYPAGLGRTKIAGAGAVAGLMLGLGLVFLTATPLPENRKPTATRVTQRPEPVAKRLASVDQTASVEEQTAFAQRPPAAVDAGWASRDVAASHLEPAHVAVVHAEAASVDAASAKAVPEPSVAATPSRDARRSRDRSPATPTVQTPAATGLPPLNPTGAFGGMSLKEALQAAARQIPT